MQTSNSTEFAGTAWKLGYMTFPSLGSYGNALGSSVTPLASVRSHHPANRTLGTPVVIPWEARHAPTFTTLCSAVCPSVPRPLRRPPCTPRTRRCCVACPASLRLLWAGAQAGAVAALSGPPQHLHLGNSVPLLQLPR